MSDEHTSTSAVAIAAATATAAAADAGDASRELDFVDATAATAKAAELIKLTIPKLEEALPALSLVELRALLVAEEAEGEGKKRTGAVSAIEAAIDAHPDQRKALEDAAGPAGGETIAFQGDDAIRAAAGGIELELPAEDVASSTLFAAVSAPVPDAIAAAVGEVAPEPVRLVLEDAVDDWTLEAVRAHLAAAGLVAIVLARRDFAHEELKPVQAAPGDFDRALDGQRIIYTGNIEISGVGLASPLPIEQAWLVFNTDAGPRIVRRCDIPGELNLAPGRLVAFRPRTLIF